MIKANNESLAIIRSHTEKCILKTLFIFFKRYLLASKSSICLSKCVNVTDPKPSSLQLLYPLEDTYRARYKSDYFPQNGTVRRPRYIADSADNHFITLQVKIGSDQMKYLFIYLDPN
jgi:hypothetical protein